MAKKIDWPEFLRALVRASPRTSTVLAFQFGLLAAAATKTIRRSKAADIPGKLIELVPSVGDLIEHVPKQPPTRRRAASRRRSRT